MKPRVYFLVGAPRSGSTSLCRILDTARNGRCFVEPDPQLFRESRDLMEGRLPNPRGCLVAAVLPRVAAVLDQGLVYGEKHVVYGPFIPHLYELLKCRFVFLRRDGRDVVTSLMNWHYDMYGTIYRECRETGGLSSRADEFRRSLPVEQDVTDYSRPRPREGEPFAEEWPRLSRFEMLAWSWAHLNRLHRASLERVSAEDWIEVDYTHVDVPAVERVFDFLGLEGFDPRVVGDMLDRRINSVRQHTGRDGRFPYWPAWDANLHRRFDRVAGDTMRLFGYYPPATREAAAAAGAVNA